MTKRARIRGLKYLLVTAVPALVALLQCTVGEASLPVYLTMAVPALVWAVISFAVMIYAFIKRRRLWAIVNFALLLAIVVFQAGYCLGYPRGESGPTLRVMTFNVQIFNNYDIEEVANAIRKESPDVVCLQEMPTTGKEHEFATLLKGYDFASAGRLAIASRLPIARIDRKVLREGARRALIAELRFHGKPIRIINVHLQHFPSDDLDKTGEASRISWSK